MRDAREPTTTPPTTRARTRQRGFSFIELLVVMGAMAVLMAVAVGYIGNLGKTSEVAQAAALIKETVFRAINASMGTQRAFVIIREDTDPEYPDSLILEAGLAGTVLTHQFETLDYASDGRAGDPQGKITLEKDGGYTGSGAHFEGGALIFPAQSQFAMTEGLEWEAWLRPEGGAAAMTVLKGMGTEPVYEIALVRDGSAPSFDVRVRLNLEEADGDARTAAAGLPKVWTTTGAPIAADGRTWSHVAVMFDGRDVRVFVGGAEVPFRAEGRRAAGAVGPRMRINVPDNGVVKLYLGGDSRSYRGMMDSVVLRGVFRSAENTHRLPDRLELVSPALPVRIEYANGRLSGTSAQRLDLWFRDLAHPNDLPLRISLGRAGSVESTWTDEHMPQPASKKKGTP